ncbi:MAG: chloride channel protein [Chthoniobacter sp.]|uniref:chloride channel protein n=1 Tax=Chthoniobacter sp. TaxID=2510640 RepID=UPI0032A55024
MTTAPHRHSVIFLSVTSIVLAGVTTVVAWALVQLIYFITNLAFYQRLAFTPASPANNHLGLIVVVVPVIGGLIIGVMARYGSQAIRGHGIPEAMEQILLNRSRIPARITVLKPVSSAISIGTGGPFGAEGPIIATGGALGSLLGQIFSVTASERKTLLAAGAAAGMTAIFGSPIAAVLLAIELLLFEFSASSLVPVALACATASAVRIWFFGSEPIFAMPLVAVPGPAVLFTFLVLGACVGVAAAFISRAVYWVEDQFEHLPVHWMWWPAIGAVGVGLIGYFTPRTFGVGYNNIEEIVANTLPIQIVAWLCAMKLFSWLIALGSGTSGGTLAPLLTIGSGLGALLAVGVNHLVPGLDLPIGLAALVGMTAMFAGASRALLASIVFAFETTMQPHALPALLAGATAAFLVAHLISKHSIMTEKIARRGVSVPHSYAPDPLAHIRVAEVMASDFQTIPAAMTVEALANGIASNDPLVSRRHASLILDEEQRLVGIITRSDVLRAADSGQHLLPVRDTGTGTLVVAHPDETLREALVKMLRHKIGRLPVVDRSDPQRAVGYLGRAEILSAETVDVREPGWIESAFPRVTASAGTSPET